MVCELFQGREVFKSEQHTLFLFFVLSFLLLTRVFKVPISLVIVVAIPKKEKEEPKNSKERLADYLLLGTLENGLLLFQQSCLLLDELLKHSLARLP